MIQVSYIFSLWSVPLPGSHIPDKRELLGFCQVLLPMLLWETSMIVTGCFRWIETNQFEASCFQHFVRIFKLNELFCRKNPNLGRWGFVFLIPISLLNMTYTSGTRAMCIFCQSEQPLIHFLLWEHFWRCSLSRRVSTSSTHKNLYVPAPMETWQGSPMEGAGPSFVPAELCTAAAAEREQQRPHALPAGLGPQDPEPSTEISRIPNDVKVCGSFSHSPSSFLLTLIGIHCWSAR